MKHTFKHGIGTSLMWQLHKMYFLNQVGKKPEWQGKCKVLWCSSLCHFLLGSTRPLLSFRCPVSDRKGCWQRFEVENWKEGRRQRGKKRQRRNMKTIENCSCNNITKGRGTKWSREEYRLAQDDWQDCHKAFTPNTLQHWKSSFRVSFYLEKWAYFYFL